MKEKISKIGIVAVFLAMLVAIAPTMATVIEFNGESADSVDQVDHLVLPEGTDGNTTIYMDNNTNGWGNISDTLVLSWNRNITARAYTLTGDSANITVGWNDWNITFTNTYSNQAGLDHINFTFNYNDTLSASEGINTSTPNTTKDALVYVSNLNNTEYTTSNTPEKQTYTVYDPAGVYDYNATATNGGQVDEDFTDTASELILNDTNVTKGYLDVAFQYTMKRGDYNDSLVPLETEPILKTHLNDTYFVDVAGEPVTNVNYKGFGTDSGYTYVKFTDTNVTTDSEFNVSATVYTTNGSQEDFYKFTTAVEPIGAPGTGEETQKADVNVSTGAVVGIGPQFFEFMEEEVIRGLSGWMVSLIVIAAVSVIGAAAWYVSRGEQDIGFSILFGGMLGLTIVDQVVDFAQEYKYWIIGIGIAIVAILSLYYMVKRR